MEVVGAIDQGTQSTRFFLYSKDAKPLVSHQVPLTQHSPQPGWCEQDPADIIESVYKAIDGCMAEAKSKLGDVKIVAIGLTNQRETTVAWDRNTGAPLCRAIVWHDTRTSDIAHRACDAFLTGHEHFRVKTGLPISTYFSALKIKWMMENVPEVAAAVAEGRCLFGTVDSWVVYNLTGGVHVTDVTNASRTLLMGIESLAWEEDLCKWWGVPMETLPRIASCAEELGRVASARVPPALAGVPVAGCIGDQQAAALGQRCHEGQAKCTYGTGAFLLLNTGTRLVRSRNGLLTTPAFQLGKGVAAQYALEGAIGVAGQGISWLKDNMEIISSPAESETLAASVPDSGGVYFVPAFGGLLAPHWRDDARGVLIGMTLNTRRAHVVRAMLDAIAMQTREVLDAMRLDAAAGGGAGADLDQLRVDGGATANSLLMQITADALGHAVVRPAHQETTSLGAAFAAGLAVGFYTPEGVFNRRVEGDTVFTPQVSDAQRVAMTAAWKVAIERSLGLADLGKATAEAAKM
ncbi:unnamed protein product [Pedinophyceae sp. YPF-701]|nr:unnamed protein product [Pedinophyceae sp. YPF-701]